MLVNPEAQDGVSHEAGMAKQASMGGVDDAVRRMELADFLRARRRELNPKDVGLPRSSRRRVSGLRREEVADLAALSLTWYTWLEQGRKIRTTPGVLDALARALHLDEANHRYLRYLGQHPVPENAPIAGASESAQGRLRALLDDQLPSPALLFRPNGDMVAWNDALRKLWRDPDTLPPQRRNGLLELANEHAQMLLVDWESHFRRVVANFRAEIGKHPGNKRAAELIAMLMDESEVFRDAWPRHEVQRRTGDRYVCRHPDVGEIITESVSLRPIGAPSLIFLVHRVTDEASRSRMLQLLAGSGSGSGSG